MTNKQKHKSCDALCTPCARNDHIDHVQFLQCWLETNTEFHTGLTHQRHVSKTCDDDLEKVDQGCLKSVFISTIHFLLQSKHNWKGLWNAAVFNDSENTLDNATVVHMHWDPSCRDVYSFNELKIKTDTKRSRQTMCWDLCPFATNERLSFSSIIGWTWVSGAHFNAHH